MRYILIVPELVRCAKMQDTNMPLKEYFKFIDLAEETVQLLVDYKKMCPKLFRYIDERVTYWND